MTEKDKVLCKDIIESIDRKFIEHGWVTVSDRYIHSALVRDEDVPEILSCHMWDLPRGDGMPGMDVKYVGGVPITSYYRYGNNVCEPFVFYRKGHVSRPDYIELSEEFRLFHRLHERYIPKAQWSNSEEEEKDYYIMKDGEEQVVAEIRGLRLRIKIWYLREYLRNRRINLVIYFDVENSSTSTYSELGITSADNKSVRDIDYTYRYSIEYNNLVGAINSCGRITGKCLLRYDVSGPINNDNKYVEFIVDEDSNGEEIAYTCDKEHLSNSFYQKENVPSAATPVFFSKRVLDRYYNASDKYTVIDGYVSCKGSWTLQVDNDNKDYVVVLLGDLGGIPYNEQLYWRTCNIGPYGKTLSQTARRRWFEGGWCNPSSPDLVLKQEYKSFNEKWKDHYGWYLFLPLIEEDMHRFHTLHGLTTQNNDSDFEEQILSLVKMTVDSLNQSKLMNNIDEGNVGVKKFLNDKKKVLGLKDISLKDITQSIDKFELFLISNSCPDHDTIITFFRCLQNLRSLNVAHRKSSENKKRESLNEYFKLEELDQRDVVDNIFKKMIRSMRFLEEVFIEGNKEVTALSEIK